MKRFLFVTLTIIALPFSAVFLLFWMHNQSGIRNTTYSERYSFPSFARVTPGLPRAKVMEALGEPLEITTNPSYPVWTLRDEAARNRYGKDNSIPIEFGIFSAPKDSERDFNWVQVSFGPEGTVLDTANYITD